MFGLLFALKNICKSSYQATQKQKGNFNEILTKLIVKNMKKHQR